jgi:replicative DNA helicase
MRRQEKKTTDTRSSADELPRSLETERAVLGALLLEKRAMAETEDILTPECFFYETNRDIYKCLSELTAEDKPTDMVSVVGRMIKERGADGGVAKTISEMVAAVGSTSSVRQHSMYLHQLMTQRNLYEAGMRIAGMAVDMTENIDESLHMAAKMIEDVASRASAGEATVSITESVRTSFGGYMRRKEMFKQGKSVGLSTGIRKLDNAISGMRPNQLIVLAARPAMGKTAFALHVAKAVASGGTPVAIFSLEMTSVSLSDRYLIAESKIRRRGFSEGTLTEAEEDRLVAGAQRLIGLPITICDEPFMTISKIKAEARMLQRKDMCGFVMIDYLQLLDGRSSNKNYNREQEVSQCSREAKLMAKSLNVPVLLLAQLSRSCEQRSDKTPILSDLRESGAIEQDADVVLMLHRPEYYDQNEPKGEGTLRIAKQRDGMTGDIKIYYDETVSVFSGSPIREEAF